MSHVVLRAALVAAMACGATACESVQPWERGDLAKPQMAIDPNPTNSMLRAHTFASREAAQGGNAGVGGGCGCN
jgi:hypothetical protein